MGMYNILWLIICVILGLIFTVGAIFLCRHRWSLLIAGFNNMPEEEKGQYDKETLCWFMSAFIGEIGICVVMLSIFTVAQITIGKYIILATMLFIIIGGLIYCNVGEHFKK